MIQFRYIKESLKKLDNDILFTDYFGDIANLILNKPKPYRIIYNQFDDVYIIADAQSVIHEEMTETALNQGYLPKTQELLNKTHMDIDEFDANNSDNIIFLTDESITDEFGSYSDKYATAEYGYEYPITTGSIFIKAKYGKSYFKRAFPDLYSKLKKYAIDDNRVMMHNSLWV